jgi:RNase P subunit RPR2
VRLGDDIDDHCSRCKRSTDHSVVSMTTSGDEVLVTRCRTCNHEHKYRHNQGRKREMTAKEAYDKLVASMPGAQPALPDELEAPKKKKRKKS